MGTGCTVTPEQKTERQIRLALDWIRRHPDQGSSVAERVGRAAWRFNVDPIDLLERVRSEAQQS